MCAVKKLRSFSVGIMSLYVVELLICAYLRENEGQLKLYMNIPKGIGGIMHKLYPLLMFKLGDHSQFYEK